MAHREPDRQLTAALDAALRARSEAGGLHPAQFAAEWGCARSWVIDLLARRDDTVPCGSNWKIREAPSASEARQQEARYRALLRHYRRRDDQRWDPGQLLAVANRALAEGEWTTLAELQRAPGWDLSRARRRLSVPMRAALDVERHLLQADMAMQRAEPTAAIAAAKRAISHGADARSALRAALVTAAAWRMVPRSGHQALTAFDQALSVRAQLPADMAAHVPARVAVDRVATWLVLGDVRAASRDAACAEDRAMSHDAATHAQVRLAQVRLSVGAVAEAAGLLAGVSDREGLPRWLRGWVTRLEVATSGQDLDDVAWNRAVAMAWRANDGYLFQQDLLLARIAAVPSRWCRDFWYGDTLGADVARAMNRRVAAHHRARHRVVPSRCGGCRGAEVPGCAAHALGFAPGALPAFWGT